MAGRTAEDNINRASRLRGLKKKMKDPGALDQLEAAAVRLERAAMRKLSKIGRLPRKKPAGSREILA